MILRGLLMALAVFHWVGLDGARVTLLHYVEEKDLPHDQGFIASEHCPSPMHILTTPHPSPFTDPTRPTELCWADRALLAGLQEQNMLRPGLGDLCRTLLTCSNPADVGGGVFHVQQ
jgi:hypothetical protein